MSSKLFVSSSRTPLKFHVDSETRVQVYPEADEAVNILNIKRGIVSAFMVPIMEKEQSRLVVSVCLIKIRVELGGDGRFSYG